MRIAVFVGYFPLVSETFILRQITGLIDMGHEVDIYAESRVHEGVSVHSEVRDYDLLARTTFMDLPPAAESEMPAWPPWENTWIPGAESPIRNVKRLWQALPELSRCFLTAPLLTIDAIRPARYGYQARSLSALYRLSRLRASSARYDVLHAHFGPVGLSFRAARQLWRAPLIVSFHGYDYSAWPKRRGPGAYQRLFETADSITVNSQYARDRLVALGSSPSQIHHLNYGVNLSEFPFRSRERRFGDPVRVLSVGRLVEKKGFEYSIRAVARVRNVVPELRYDIVGDGPLRKQLENVIREVGVEREVFLHGSQTGEVVRRLMAEADLFILSSVTAATGDQEGTPVSLMEAQASGLPVLSTWHSGIPEVVLHEQSGFLVPERDTDALADRLRVLLDHPEMWPPFGLAGRMHMERRFDLERVNSQLFDLYATTAAAYRAASNSKRAAEQ